MKKELGRSFANLARTQNAELLNSCKRLQIHRDGIVREHLLGPVLRIDLSSSKLGKTYADRNAKLCAIIQKIAEGLAEFSTDINALGDAYAYLIGQFAAGAGQKAGEPERNVDRQLTRCPHGERSEASLQAA